ncbi:uncharacterized protein BXZ73DRAFT_95391 [Epithele typhae]|uniref:uncharacterized protein n=1 Tax=Epithele typhae TaxID=378194 RepID=UPI00200811D2|nr:uncharacterized protein BXZ73DRAFT_95391 [Epithele typhae]KAH9945873.1 hypothetical protein BXZ73DRAFT_95391 [Epithele typhae]
MSISNPIFIVDPPAEVASSKSSASVAPAPVVEHELVMRSMHSYMSRNPRRMCDVPVRLRKYTVTDMAPDWALKTTTTMRERGGRACHDWLMHHAPDYCLTPEDLSDLAICHSLTFHTRTALVRSQFGVPGADTAPRTLYFYERVSEIGPASNVHFGYHPGVGRGVLFYGGETHRDGVFRWKQMLGLNTVQIHAFGFTPDECLVLREMAACATEAERAECRFDEDPDDDADDCAMVEEDERCDSDTESTASGESGVESGTDTDTDTDTDDDP